MNVIRYAKVLSMALILSGHAVHNVQAQMMSNYIRNEMDVQVRSIIVSDVVLVDFRESKWGKGGLGTSSFGSVETQAIGLVVAIAVKAVTSTIGRSVTSSRKDEAHELVQPLIENLGDFRFRDTFRAQLRDRMTALPIRTTDRIIEINTQEELNAASRDAAQTLEILTMPFLTEDAARFVVVTDVGLFYRGTERAISSRRFFYISKSVAENGDPESAIILWADRNAEHFKKVSVEVAQETMEMLESEILRDAIATNNRPVQKFRIIAPSTALHKKKYEGVVIRSSNDRAIVRTVDGPIISLPTKLLDF